VLRTLSIQNTLAGVKDASEDDACRIVAGKQRDVRPPATLLLRADPQTELSAVQFINEAIRFV
jgi:hypothetical protein